MELPVVCPCCWDTNIARVVDAKLYAENLPQQMIPIAGAVFRCAHWHVFAIFQRDGPSRTDAKPSEQQV